jgi:hypothetical protein
MKEIRTKQKLGFIGVGIMGSVDQSRVDELVKLGAQAATSLEQLVSNSDIIACSLPNRKRQPITTLA